MRVYTSADQLIGHTPLMELKHLESAYGLNAKVLAKLEYLNPAGSVKDRAALSMIRDAETMGRLSPGGTVIEPTSGNTGIGLASVCAARGYRLIITMPDSMSRERILIMRAYGAEVVLTPGKEGMSGAIAKAEEIMARTPGSIIAGQFTNPANPAAHYQTTGPEIWEDTDGTADVFVAGIGTGGTITGVGKYLKEKNPAVRVVGVEPASSPLLTKGISGAHGLQGIGANFVPEILDRTLLDEIIPVTEEEAYRLGREMGRKEGILVGITSGAALYAAVLLAKRPENAGKTIVALLPDTGDRYLTTPLFEGKDETP